MRWAVAGGREYAGQDHTAAIWLYMDCGEPVGAGGGRGPYAVRTPSGLAPRGRGRAAATTAETGADRGGRSDSIAELYRRETPLMAHAICRLQVAVVQQ